MNPKFIKFLALIAVGAAIWFCPHPQAVSAQAWHLFAIVVATILGLILQPIPIGAIAFIGVTVAVLSKVLNQPTLWAASAIRRSGLSFALLF